MKILHLMIVEKFTKPVSLFYNENFGDRGHEICYILKKDEKSLPLTDLIIPNITFRISDRLFDDYKRIKRLYDSYDFVVVHSIWVLPIISHLLYFMSKSMLNKTIWIEWGSDLYDTGKTLNPLKNIKRLLLNRIKNNCFAMVGIFQPDCVFFKTIFPKSKSRVLYAPYCGNNISPDLLKPYNSICHLEETITKGEPVYILIGHNGMETLNHIEVLRYLKRFAANNIKIVLSLGYGGSKKYANKVQKMAQELFPNKVVCLRKMIPYSEYMGLIEKIDIAIFDTKRQCGLGNIYSLIYHNVKIFMPHDGVMYNFFYSNGVPVQKLETLKTINFETFVRPVSPHNTTLFDEYISKLSSFEWQINCWNNVYSFLEEEMQKRGDVSF